MAARIFSWLHSFGGDVVHVQPAPVAAPAPAPVAATVAVSTQPDVDIFATLRRRHAETTSPAASPRAGEASTAASVVGLCGALPAILRLATAGPSTRRTVFDGPPSKTLGEFLGMLQAHKVVVEEHITNVLIYIARLAERGLPVTSDNIHKLFVAALLVAAKFLEDIPFNNKSFSICSGSAEWVCVCVCVCVCVRASRRSVLMRVCVCRMPTAELASLEIALIGCLTFDVNVDPRENALVRQYLGVLVEVLSAHSLLLGGAGSRYEADPRFHIFLQIPSASLRQLWMSM
eukprot:TRINITY_DN3934_c0_g1_i1.p2 TRINITY_DN3934_c0_g1~~TRINITY_DN3934_c0_g1_i1.p2  ORF type:complete len:302 (+),score=96.92 TRINITY_DN3934_c0_g1_i1:40-906(+)